MPATLYRKELNTQDGIKAMFYFNDALVDPFLVQYTIYKPLVNPTYPQGTIPYIDLPEYTPIISQVEKTPIRVSIGYYYADWTVNDDAPIGRWVVQWIFKVDSADQLQQKSDTFYVVRDLSESCEARHIPSGNGSSAIPNGSGHYTEQSGSCCDNIGYVRDHFGRIINL